MGTSSTPETYLRRLAWARLGTVALVLATGATLIQSGAAGFSFPAFALAMAAAGVAGAVLLAVLIRRVPPGHVAWVHIAADVVLVTAIVATTGGARSLFAPLYVPVIVAACVVLSRPGGLVTAGLSSLAYAGILLGQMLGPELVPDQAGEDTPLGLLTIFLNAAVFLVVAIVAGSLAQQCHRAQANLAIRHRDLSDLQALRDLLFDSIGSGLIGLSTDGRITAFNRAAEAITGVASPDAVGQPWAAIFGTGIDLANTGAAAAASADAPRRHEMWIRRTDGRELPVGVSFWLLRTGSGAEAGLIGVCQDLSWIKQMEERVRQADRLAAVGRLSANIAHEIRNPLGALAGAIEALVKELPPEAAHSPLAEIALRESDRLNRIITDFLEYARPGPLSPIDVNLSEVLDEVLLLLEHGALPDSHKIVRQYGESVPAHVDPQQIRQAIWNICLNGIHAMPHGGELRVSAGLTPSGDCVEISIADTGPGIPEADLPTIFEPFHTNTPGGTGIGLAIVYRIVQDHGGQVDLQSWPDVGSVFTLTLPTRSPATA